MVRDELTSGRLAEHLRRIGRADLVPRPEPTQTADEQLDAWLARLPASRSSDPELDVHPQTLVIRAATAGGLIRKSLRITNVGYRLLRSTARVEPAASTSIRVAAEFSARPFLTIDHTDIPVEIELPENARPTTLGTVVVESNGGTRRIEILLERPALNAATAEGANGSGPVDLVIDTRPLGELVAAQPVARRLILVPLALVVFRLLVLVAGLIPLGASGASRFEPRLGSIALLLAAAGALIGHRAGQRDPRSRSLRVHRSHGRHTGCRRWFRAHPQRRVVAGRLGELTVCGTAALGLAGGCDRPGIVAGPAPVPTDLDTPAGAHDMTSALHGLALLPAMAALVFAAGSVVAAQDEVPEPEAAGNSGDSTVVVTGASQQEFPRITVQFEVRQPDGSFLLDATREDFRVTEDGKDVQVLDFQAPGPPRPSPRRSCWSSITAGAWSKRTGSDRSSRRSLRS